MKKYFFLVTAVLIIALSLVAIAITPQVTKQALETMETKQDGIYVARFMFIDFYFSTTEKAFTKTMCVANILNIAVSLLMIELAMKKHVLRYKIELVLVTALMFVIGRNILLVGLAAHMYWLFLTFALLVVNALVALLLKRTSDEDNRVKAPKVQPLEERKYTTKDRVIAIIAIAVYLALYIFSYKILQLIFPQMSKEALKVANQVCDWSVLPILIILFKDDLKRGIKGLWANKVGYFRLIIKILIVEGVAGYILNVIIHMLSQDFIPENQASLNQRAFLSYVLSAIIFSPIVEELLFRESLRRFIKNKVVFVVASALLFGLAHSTSEGNIVTFLFSMTLYSTSGAFLAYAYAKTNNICTGIICHCIGNAYAVIS